MGDKTKSMQAKIWIVPVLEVTHARAHPERDIYIINKIYI